jgi:putative phage-type endonuclease
MTHQEICPNQEICPIVQKLLSKTYDDQRSAEWFSLRGNLLTASDAAAALDLNFFKSSEALLIEKCGYKKSFTNANIERGIRLEPEVRDMYDLQYKKKSHEIGLLVHPVHTWLGGSADGITEDGYLIEIKCPNKISPKVPVYYLPQIQILMEITELEICHFIQYHETTGTLKVIEVPRDREWFEAHLPKMKKFWDRVLEKRENGLCEIEI